MRLFFNATEKDVKLLKQIKKHHKKKLSLNQMFQEAIKFYIQIHILLSNGYKICIEDEEGNQKYFGGDKKD